MTVMEWFRYSMRTEQRLSAIVRSGDPVGAGQILDEIYADNLADQRLPASQKAMLLCALSTTLLRIVNDLENAEKRAAFLDQLENVTENRSTQESFNALKALFRELASEYRRGLRAQAVISKIRRYMDECFADQELNLNNTAERFGLSVSYLSQSFRKTVGINFSAYLEALRVDKACEYLSQGMSVKQTSERVGYNSVYVFRKAFLRRKSVLPSNYGEKNCI